MVTLIGVIMGLIWKFANSISNSNTIASRLHLVSASLMSSYLTKSLIITRVILEILFGEYCISSIMHYYNQRGFFSVSGLESNRTSSSFTPLFFLHNAFLLWDNDMASDCGHVLLYNMGQKQEVNQGHTERPGPFRA